MGGKFARLRTSGDGQGVKGLGVPQGKAKLLKPSGQRCGQTRNATGDCPEPVGAVIDRIHRCHHGGQHLRGTDVRSCLLTANVLLAGLEG